MQETKPALMGYYYFDFTDPSKRSVHGLLASLLFQLGDSSDSCRDVLHKLYTSCSNGLGKPSDTDLVGCLKSILELPGQLPIFLIVDALDECLTTGTPSPRDELLDFLEDLVGSSHSNLSICVTSRPEQDIQSVLSPLTPESCRVSLHEEGGQMDDIKSYVEYFVHNKDRAMRKWREEDRNLVITTLIERAGGM